MALNLQPNETPTGGEQAEDHGVQHETGYGYLPVGQGKDDCKAEAESGGAVVWDEHAQACWKVFGRAVIIGHDEFDIEEGFEMVNFNFHTSGTQPAVPSQNDLPDGSSSGGMEVNGAPSGTKVLGI